MRAQPASRGRPGRSRRAPESDRRLRPGRLDDRRWRSTATPETAWGIYPAGRQAARGGLRAGGADLQLRDGGTTLTFVLEQTHGRGHLDRPVPPLGHGRAPAGSRRRRCPTRSPRSSRCPRPSGTDDAAAGARAHSSTATRRTSSSPRCRRRRWSTPPPATSPPTAASQPAGGPPAGPRPDAGRRQRSPAAAACRGARRASPGCPGGSTIADANDEGARRAALARWLTDPRNAADLAVDRQPRLALPLRPRPRRHAQRLRPDGRHADAPGAARLAGRRGSATDGGSLKQLHRLIVTSAAYRQSSGHDPDGRRGRRRQPPALADEPPPARRRERSATRSCRSPAGST